MVFFLTNVVTGRLLRNIGRPLKESFVALASPSPCFRRRSAPLFSLSSHQLSLFLPRKVYRSKLPVSIRGVDDPVHSEMADI